MPDLLLSSYENHIKVMVLSLAEQAEDEFIAQLNIRSPASIPFVSNVPNRKIEALSFFIALPSVYRLFSCKHDDLIARRLV